MIVEVKGLVKEFSARRLRALDGVSFSVAEKSCMGIVGESGSGKTTLAKILLRLIPATSGSVSFDQARIRSFRKDVQIIFQNPYNSLNPKMRIGSALAEPLLLHGLARRSSVREKVSDLLEQVGLEPGVAARYPREFSGGQRQRICIARALASQPKILVCDEPISSLDLTIQAQMLDLFKELKSRYQLTYLFISHNLAVIRHIADTVLVMQHGRVVEQGTAGGIFSAPQQAYTRMLLAAAGTKRLR